MTLAHKILAAAHDQDTERCSQLLPHYRAALLECSHDDVRLDDERNPLGSLHHQMVFAAKRVEDQAHRGDRTLVPPAVRLLAMTELHWRRATHWDSGAR